VKITRTRLVLVFKRNAHGRSAIAYSGRRATCDGNTCVCPFGTKRGRGAEGFVVFPFPARKKIQRKPESYCINRRHTVRNLCAGKSRGRVINERVSCCNTYARRAARQSNIAYAGRPTVIVIRWARSCVSEGPSRARYDIPKAETVFNFRHGEIADKLFVKPDARPGGRRLIVV